MEELDVGEFLQLYCDSINTKYDSKVLGLTGFYKQTGTSPYGGYYYDSLFSKESGFRISVLVSEDHREQLTDGKNYTLKGYVNRSKKLDKDSKVNLNFRLLEVKSENKEKQLIKQEEYDLLKERHERGFTDIRQLIMDCLEDGKSPSILIITGNDSIVDQDFKSQLSAFDTYQIEIKRTGFGSADQIVAFLDLIETSNYDLISFMRGGGSGLDVFDSDKLCQKSLELKKPILTAIGHKDDRTLLCKIADKDIPTPSAFGSFLQGIAEDFENRMTLLSSLSSELKQKEELLIKETELRSYQTKKAYKKVSGLRRLVAILLIALLITLYFLFKDYGI